MMPVHRLSFVLGSLSILFLAPRMVAAQPGMEPLPEPAAQRPAPPPPSPAPTAEPQVAPLPPPPAPMEPRVRHYGWKIVAVDAASLALALATEDERIFGYGYLLGGPAVHMLHGRGTTAVLSIGLRAGMPLGGALLGQVVSGCDESSGPCSFGSIVIGGVLGMLSAVAIDAVWLAKEVDYVPVPQPSILSIGGVRANPGVGVSRSGSFTLGLDGTF